MSIDKTDATPKFTPGPWTLSGRCKVTCGDMRSVDVMAIIRPDGITVFDLPYADRATNAGDADARLIAAAPELYEAGTEIETHISQAMVLLEGSGNYPRVNQSLAALRRALAKARGEAPHA